MHRNLRKVVGTLALTAVAVLGVAACGSSDNGSSAGAIVRQRSGTSRRLQRDHGPLHRARAADDTHLRGARSPTHADGRTSDQFDKIDEIIGNVQAKAPDEIKDDVATVAKNFQDVRAIFAQYDFDISKLTSAATADPALTDEAAGAQQRPSSTPPASGSTPTCRSKCGIAARGS